MRALAILLLVLSVGCATRYFDSSDSQPRLASIDPQIRVFVRIRSLPLRVLQSTLVDGGYCMEAIHLAQHSRKKVSAGAPGPIGRGYLMEVVQNEEVIDQFEFWPEEIVVRGQRWLIEDKKLAAHERMVWFGEIPAANRE